MEMNNLLQDVALSLILICFPCSHLLQLDYLQNNFALGRSWEALSYQLP